MKPTVSVIVATYNMKDLICETIDSIIAQDYKPIEVIVVDDGSTDDTQKILQKYVEKGEISYVFQANGGSAKARNTGFKKSTGEFVMFIDADDLLVAEAITKMVDRLIDLGDSYCLVYGERERFNHADGKTLGFTKISELFGRGSKSKNIFKARTNVIMASVIRRGAFQEIGLFDERFRYNEDSFAFLRLSQIGLFYGLGEIVLRYRVRDDSKTRKRSYERAVQVTEGREITYREISVNENILTRLMMWGYHYFFAGVEFADFDKKESRKYFLKSLLIWPFNFECTRLLVANLRGRY